MIIVFHTDAQIVRDGVRVAGSGGVSNAFAGVKSLLCGWHLYQMGVLLSCGVTYILGVFFTIDRLRAGRHTSGPVLFAMGHQSSHRFNMSSLVIILSFQVLVILLSFQRPVCLLALDNVCYRVRGRGGNASSSLVDHKVHLIELEVSL